MRLKIKQTNKPMAFRLKKLNMHFSMNTELSFTMKNIVKMKSDDSVSVVWANGY